MNSENNKSNWKTQVYFLGALSGLMFGLIGSYLFARAAEEDVERNSGQMQRIPTGQLVALSLSALALIRQITEMGKGKGAK